jgi:predicted nuclease of predicted toxin-antitoxin system
MRFKVDENLPIKVASELRDSSHDIQTVHDEGLVGHTDADVWEAAQSERRILITQDLDFSDIRIFSPGLHHGIVVIRLRNPSRRALIARTLEVLAGEDVEGWSRCFVVVTERKVRVRRP